MGILRKGTVSAEFRACNPYNQGRLGRYSTYEPADRLQESMLLYLNDNLNDAMKSAAKQLQVVLCAGAYNIFALDVFYHRPVKVQKFLRGRFLLLGTS